MRRRLLLLALAAVPACTTGELVRMNMRGGETRPEVEQMLGRPDGYRRDGNNEALTYSNRAISGWDIRDKADYIVILTDGRVSAYGPGTVRTSPGTQALILVPLR